MRVALLLYPLLELWSLIELGAATSAGLAVLWVLGAGFVGMATIRFAGAQVLSRLQAAQQQGMLQQQLVAGDMALAIAGLLLVIPGLISDALAVLVLIRPVRRLLGTAVAAGWSQGAHHAGSAHAHRQANQDGFQSRQTAGNATPQEDGVTLEGEFREVESEAEQLAHQASDARDSRER
jgi:UPF0716 protein FxsA